MSFSRVGLIIVHSKLYQSQFHIKNAHESGVWSLYVLIIDDLISSWDEAIKIWRINENDYNLIHKLKEHTNTVRKVIKLKDGKLCS